MKRHIAFILIGGSLMLSGCGAGVPTTTTSYRAQTPSSAGTTGGAIMPPVTQPVVSMVTVTPASARINTSYGNQKSTLQFSASVQAADTTVRWYVNDILGGNATVGTISETGTYTAPEEVRDFPVVIKAVANADPNQYGSALVALEWYFSLDLTAPEGVQVPASGRLPLLLTLATKLHDVQIIWTVSGVRTGTATSGFVVPDRSNNSKFWYFAPPTAPAEPIVIAAARKNYEDTLKSISLSVVIDDTASSLSISPRNGSLEVTQQQRLRAYESGEERTVTWLVNGSEETDGRFGWLRDGLYTAPFTVPTPAEVLITAADTSSTPNRFASTLLTIRSSPTANARVVGTFAFNLQGQDGFRLGVLTFDGVGTVEGWLQSGTVWDYERVYESEFRGTYQTEMNGHVSVRAALSSAVRGIPNELSFDLAFVSPDVADAWSSGSSGLVERQRLEATTASAEALAGRFILDLRSYFEEPNITCLGWACSLPWDSQRLLGYLELDSTGKLGGKIESPGATTFREFSGELRAAAHGVAPGTLRFPESEYNAGAVTVVVVSSDKLLIGVATGTRILSAVAERQTMLPASASLKGAYIFQNQFQHGRFEADGAGRLQGTMDYILPGLPFGFMPNLPLPTWKEDVPFTGTYEVDEHGRVTVALAPSTNDPVYGDFPKAPVVYLQSPKKLKWADQLSAIGTMFAQEIPAFDESAIEGLYAMRGTVGPMTDGLLVKESGRDAFGVAGHPAVAVTMSFGEAESNGKGVVTLSAPEFAYGPTIATEKYFAVSSAMLIFRTGAVLERFTWGQ